MTHKDTAPTPGRPSAGDRGQAKTRHKNYCWWTGDWIASDVRLDMTAEQRGVFRDVLDFIYQDGSIPADEPALIRRLAVTEDEFGRSWPGVRAQLIDDPDVQGRLTHPRALRQRAEAEAYRQKQSTNGRLGGRGNKATRNPPLSSGKSQSKASQKPPSPSPSPSLFPDPPPHPEALRAEADGGDPPTLGQAAPGRESAAPAKTSSKPATPNGAVDDTSFSQWWAIWLKKQHRSAAHKAFRKVIRTQAEFELLMRTTPLYVERQYRYRELAMVPDPETFLLRGDWREEDPPVLRRGPDRESRLPLAERVRSL